MERCLLRFLRSCLSRLIERRTGCMLMRVSVLTIYAVSGQLNKSSLDVCPCEPRHTYQVAQCAICPPLLPQFIYLSCDLHLPKRGSSHVFVSYSDVLPLLPGSIWPPLSGGVFVSFARPTAHIWYTGCCMPATVSSGDPRYTWSRCISGVHLATPCTRGC